jgi:CheY-like chemotaxis protein
VVEDDDNQRKSIIELIDHDDVAITAVSTGHEALDELGTQRYDCMVLDLMLSDMTGFELLDRIRENEQLTDLPIIIYTGKDLDSKEEMQLRKYAESIIIKDVKSPERLFDETMLFLHRVEAKAMRRIRRMPPFEKLPVIALTAKAMKDDRSKCIEAGASDYVKKPIQTEQLLSLMRVWLYS